MRSRGKEKQTIPWDADSATVKRSRVGAFVKGASRETAQKEKGGEKTANNKNSDGDSGQQ